MCGIQRSVAPRRWGSTPDRMTRAISASGCPTPVGIYLIFQRRRDTPVRLPHAGGDLPQTGLRGWSKTGVAPRRWGSTQSVSSPHPGHRVAPRRWGSTVERAAQDSSLGGCPTPVGIYRRHHRIAVAGQWLPHAGGGLPPEHLFFRDSARRLPHAGGGLPSLAAYGRGRRVVAPRRWGSTGLPPQRTGRPQGCPTPVGIHPCHLPVR